MARRLEADICVVGGGSAGLSVAAGASQMGAKVVLIEAGKMGGDCLNYGCVPSKALLAAGHAAHTVRHAGRFGINGHVPHVDFGKVHDHVHDVIAGIAPLDSQERFESLGATVIRAHASFCAPDEIEAGDVRVHARRFVLATGSSPMVPPIPGLDRTPYQTNETIFDNRAAPDHLLVIGGGPIGCELAQAHRRLGSAVTVLDMGPILPKDDPELTGVVRSQLEADGVVLRERVQVQAVEPAGNGVAVACGRDGASERIEGSDLLVAAGRAPNVEGMNLEIAQVQFDRHGIKVDARLRTTNRKIFAIGDAIGGYQFTHVGNYHAGIVIRNALFRLPAKVDYRALPWVTYTDPELAHVGLTEAQATLQGHAVEVLRWPFEENDRARTERQTGGLIKAIVGKRGRILGASIVGAHAGELILPWVLAIRRKLKIAALADVIVPYPTLGEVSKRAAGSYYTAKLFSPRTRWLVRQLARLG
jgi:pyruvate/2-oxoglutarate dehydrogenase complex dihydrolipoamide dehydrogenase (E3) component